MVDDTTIALKQENEQFNERYHWFVNTMPEAFFKEIDQAKLMLIVHNIMEFANQDYFSIIQLKHSAIVICLDKPDIDIQVLKNFASYGIESYQTYVSQNSPPFISSGDNIRVVVVHFFGDKVQPPCPEQLKQQVRPIVKQRYPQMTDQEFNEACQGMTTPFLQSLNPDKIAVAMAMYLRAKSRDSCQYEVIYHEDWESKKSASMQFILAWKNTPRHNFLYRLVRAINRHGIAVRQISASYKDIYKTDSILVLSLDLHGAKEQPVWEMINILDLVKELTTVKYFASFDYIDRHLVLPGIVTGNYSNLLRAMQNWIHQSLVHLDANLYTIEHIEEGLCRHPELTSQLIAAFKYRFDPDLYDNEKYQEIRRQFELDIEKLDTGHEENDIRRKNILKQGMNFIQYTLKTNFYRPNYTSLSFRLDPRYLEEIPFDRSKKFPELPYAIIFIKGMHFFGFHIRFKDLARGGLRTVYPEHTERMVLERNTVFTECYNLAYTQHLKNKDIPEGGAKGIIFLQPYDHLESEVAIFHHELKELLGSDQQIETEIDQFRKEQRLEHLYQAQRSFIESLITIVNCDATGRLYAKDIIDYWGKPEYLYLGPDENLHDVMIQWIAEYSKKQHYKPGSSFISGKPRLGINHKEYGVTSLGVNVYLDATLRYLGIDPERDQFTIKMSGGPDGDVAGNEINNLHIYYPNTAKLLALTDVSGTIYDPKGLDLKELSSLFHQGLSIRHYPPQKLNSGGFLVDKFSKKAQSTLIQNTLCWRMQEGKLQEEWLSGSDMNFLIRNNVHQVYADVFIPAGGRPRTLNESNYKDFLGPTGRPTARAIIEGANLYLSPSARRALEDLGVLIIKDSSANKTGVICSSFEVLSGLTMGDEQFLENKATLVKEIMNRLKECAANEAKLLLTTHGETGERLTEISDRISRRINLFTDQLLDYLEPLQLSNKEYEPLIMAFYRYCLPLLRYHYQKELLEEIPDQHKKAIIACYIASSIVYSRGLNWFPSIVDILPTLRKE